MIQVVFCAARKLHHFYGIVLWISMVVPNASKHRFRVAARCTEAERCGCFS